MTGSIFMCRIGKEEEVHYKGFHFIFNDRFGFIKLKKNGEEAKRAGQKFLDIAQEWYDKKYLQK